jgi:hypothetical protein
MRVYYLARELWFRTVVDREDAVFVERDGVHHRLRRGWRRLLRRRHIRCRAAAAAAATQGARGAAEGAGSGRRCALRRDIATFCFATSDGRALAGT